MAKIELRAVHKAFGKTQVIRDASLTVEDNEFVVFVGPSGCGKSTLLRLLSGLDDVTSGEILIDDERVEHLPPSKRGIAMVFQSYALYPHMTVYENMSYSLRVARQPKAEIDKTVRKAAEILQLTELLDRRPKALSGGQRQRVAIGRAIVRDPKVFLFDEPLSNLDAKLRVQMRIELTKIHRTLNATMIYVTHDQVEAMTMADKIVVIKDGIIEQIGAPLDLYRNPGNMFVAGFIGSPAMNFFEGKVRQKTDAGLVVDLDADTSFVYPAKDHAGAQVGDKVHLGVRPEHLGVRDTGDGNLTGEVYAVERLGSETYLYMLSATGKEIVVHSADDEDVSVGETVVVGFTLERSHLFGPTGRTIT
jgi:multiple sugar transport system ATP-binding protein